MDQHVFRVWIRFRRLCLKVIEQNCLHLLQILPFNWYRIQSLAIVCLATLAAIHFEVRDHRIRLNYFAEYYFYLATSVGCIYQIRETR